jgi:ketosteroid isomerase-like protein
MGEAVVHPSTDPGVVIIEFEGFGRGVTTDEPYDQRYVSVIHTARGRIVHYRDYWNPLVVLRATKGAALVDALTTGEATHA